MALSITQMSQTLTKPPPNFILPQLTKFSFPNLKPYNNNNTLKPHFALCLAAKPQTGAAKAKQKPPTNKSSSNNTTNSSKQKKKKKTNSANGSANGSAKRGGGKVVKEVKTMDDLDSEEEEEFEEDEREWSKEKEEREKMKSKKKSGSGPPALAKPPAGFVIDETGRVVMAAPNRLVTIVDPFNSRPLECMIRRAFTNSKGQDCLLLCPVDMPVQVLKSNNFEGWASVEEEDLEPLLPDIAYALAKMHMHLVHSGYCYTARGTFCYSEENIFLIPPEDVDDEDAQPTEAIEISMFPLNGVHYMVYTAADPLLFIAIKDEDGKWEVADEDVSDDPAVTKALDEETEFHALVEEEAALMDAALGEAEDDDEE